MASLSAFKPTKEAYMSVARLCFIETCQNIEDEMCMCVKHYTKFLKARKNKKILRVEQLHGKTKTPEYGAWSNMKSRCNNKNAEGYINYGGRGISVCSRWSGFDGFKNFLEDMGPRPTSKHSLDRVDVNGNYEPSNCRWTDRRTQAINQRLKKSNTSGYKNIHFQKHINKWCLRKNIDGRRVTVGYFSELKDAVNALSNET